MKKNFVIFFSLLALIVKVYAQDLPVLGAGFVQDKDQNVFYAPIWVNVGNNVALKEGAAIVAIGSKKLTFNALVLKDTFLWKNQKEIIKNAIENCENCKISLLNPQTGEVETLKLPYIRCNYAMELSDAFPAKPSSEKPEGYAGFTWKMEKDSQYFYIYRPVIKEVKPGSPAELAGLKPGNVLQSIQIGKTKEALFNLPPEWLMAKLSGPVGEKCSLFVEGSPKAKVIKRTKLIGNLNENPQAIAGCISGNCYSGYGIMESGLERYEGLFKNGKKSGKGKIFQKDRLIFEGYFSANEKNGPGSEYLANGNKAQRNYTKGKPGEYAKITDVNGNVSYEVKTSSGIHSYNASFKALTQGAPVVSAKDFVFPEPSPEKSEVTPPAVSTPMPRPTTVNTPTQPATPAVVAEIETPKAEGKTQENEKKGWSIKKKTTKVEESETKTEISVTQTEPKPTVTAPKPAVTQTEPKPAVTAPKPAVTQTEPKPAVTAPKPAVTQTEPKPAVTAPKPAVTQTEPKPAVTAPKPAVTQSEPKPAVSATKPAVTQTEPKPAVTATDSPYPATPIQGENACKYCRGKGYFNKYVKCTNTECVKGNVPCKTCVGTGTVKDIKTGKSKPCTDCHIGTPTMPHVQDCKTCTGNGMMIIGSSPCGMCKGTGTASK